MKWGGETQTSFPVVLDGLRRIKEYHKEVGLFLGITAIAFLGVNALSNSPDVSAMLKLPFYPPSVNLIDRMVVGTGELLASVGLGVIGTLTILDLFNDK